LIGKKSPGGAFADISFVAGGGFFIGKKSPAALFADVSFVAGGKKRGFWRLR